MPMIQNYTFDDLTRDALDRVRKTAPQMLELLRVERRGSCESLKSTKLTPYFNIEYDGQPRYEANTACRRRHEDVAIRAHVRINSDTLFYIVSAKTGRDAYMAVFDTCQALTNEIDRLIQSHADVLKYDHELIVRAEYKGENISIKLSDILHRRWHCLRFDKTVHNYRWEHIPKHEMLPVLRAALAQYGDILMPRKIERLNIFIAEIQGDIPDCKARQKYLREHPKTT